MINSKREGMKTIPHIGLQAHRSRLKGLDEVAMKGREEREYFAAIGLRQCPKTAAGIVREVVVGIVLITVWRRDNAAAGITAMIGNAFHAAGYLAFVVACLKPVALYRLHGRI